MNMLKQHSPPFADPWRPRTATIAGMRSEIPHVVTYDLQLRGAPEDAGYHFRAGQFNMLYLPGIGEAAISISSDPASTSTLAHTIRAVGNVTRRLAGLKPGDTLGLRGPFGRGWPIDEALDGDVILIAGGLGLAPLRPAIYQLLADRPRFGKLSLLYGARTPDTLLFASEWGDWNDRGLTVQTTVDRATPAWRGHVGVVTLLLERLSIANPSNTVVFMCGPEVMMRYVARGALDRGIPMPRIHCALERNMQCAVGFCGHCQYGPAFVCKDGPVFSLDRLMPFLWVEGL